MTRFSQLVQGAVATLPWALGCLFVAGIVHIASVLMMPHFAQRDAYALLGGSTQGVTLLPAAETKQLTPFQDPAFALGVCRYDLGASPARIRTLVTGDGFLSISFHDRGGRIFYSTTDRAALRGKIDILLVDARQLDALEANDPEDQAPQELRLLSPTQTGFVLVRSLIERTGAEAGAAQTVQSVTCRPEAN